jgi:crotonobetainyl-CoA:carnitine CoA-transferase CaiB-like acyl-CoA transferase
VPHPELERDIIYPGFFAKTSAEMWSLRRRPPTLGEHNKEIYCGELKLSEADLSALKAAGAI